MNRQWTSEEDHYLLAHFGKSERSFLASVLNRSEDAIASRYRKLLKDQESQEFDSSVQFILERANRVSAKRLPKKHKSSISTKKLSPNAAKGSAYAHTKTGYRPELGFVCRSGWEANVARIMKSYNIQFNFEPMVFQYPIKRGNKAYTPDFYLPATNEWIEVKGYLDKNSQIKIKRFKKYYPEEFSNFTMIIGRNSRANREFCKTLEVPNIVIYDDLRDYFKPKIKTWEGR